ncbi:uncharacterized protein LOC129295117 [Prosopis cineraria]|uniref:uncharacterized protein LOC129295117 n=1 Tax=Prosopis cineraria TaxID=364024 RepID=UPI00240F8426|nr:uncharacterized protein LOC129295117 [Prosopis cineraria]
MGNRRFDFIWEPPGGPNSRYCDSCGQDVRGFLYHDQYSKHKFDLHPCCMNLKRTMSDPNGTVELNLKDQAPSKCVKCKRKYLNNVQSKEAFRGWSYVSSCGNYCYHVYCVKTLILENREKGYFNVASSSSSSSSSSLVIGSETASATSSLAMDRRRRSSKLSVTRALIKMVKVGFSVIISVLFGNPPPLFVALAENLLE